MKILNGKVFENGKFVEKKVATDGSFFAADSGDGKEIDAAGCYVIPGLIDIHFHGCAGVDFCDGTVEAMRHMAEYELQWYHFHSPGNDDIVGGGTDDDQQSCKNIP